MSEPNKRSRIVAVLAYVVENMLPLIAFILLSRLVSVKAAIVAVVVLALLDGIRRLVFGIPYNRLILLATVMTVLFGSIDLLAPTPFMLHYEGVISNLLVGIAFVLSTLGRKSIVQTLSEQGQNEDYADRPDLQRFFLIVTLIWAAYFIVKSGVYLYLGLTLPLARVIDLRATWGTISLGVMFIWTAALGRPLFRALKRRGVLPDAPGGR